MISLLSSVAQMAPLWLNFRIVKPLKYSSSFSAAMIRSHEYYIRLLLKSLPIRFHTYFSKTRVDFKKLENGMLEGCDLKWQSQSVERVKATSMYKGDSGRKVPNKDMKIELKTQ